MDITALSQLAGGAPLAQPIAAPPPLPDDLVVEDFENAVRGAAVATQPGVSNSATAAAPGTGTVGDAILRGMEQISGETLSAWGKVKTYFPPGTSPSTADLINFQSNVLQFTFLYELVGKGVSKSAQNIESLVKLQ